MDNIVTLIIAGGELKQEFLNTFINNQKINYIIAVDKGLEILDKINVLPNYLIGDFDSVNTNLMQSYNKNKTNIIKLNPEKDFSDTHMALKLAIKLKSKQIYILGALGKRIDHAIANIHILKEAIDNDIECKIIDENNTIQLMKKESIIVKKEKYKYISLIPLTTEVNGITLKGFKYPLNNATLKIGHSIGISNEIIEKDAYISINEGILIVIESKD